MPALIPTILKGILFLLLFLTDLLLFLLSFPLFVLSRYRSSGAREEKQLSGCFLVSWLSSLLRLNPSYMAEEKVEFPALGFHAHHSDETEDTADTTEESDFGYPEFMASEDFEPDTVETAIVEQQKAIIGQVEISSEYFEVAGPVSNRKGIPPQREDKRRRNVLKEEQCAMRHHGRSRRRFRKQRDQTSAGTRKLQDSVRLVETRFDLSQDERTQHFLRSLR